MSKSSRTAPDLDENARMRAVWDRIEKRAAEKQSAGGNSKRVEQNDKKGKHPADSKRRRIILIVLAAVGVLVVIVACLVIFTDIDDKIINRIRYHNVKVESVEQAGQMMADGDTDAVVYYYEQQAAQADGAEAQAEQYLKLVEILTSTDQNGEYNQGNLNRAIQYALKAEELNPSFESASALYTIYYHLGDEENASKYLDIQQQRFDDEGVELNG